MIQGLTDEQLRQRKKGIGGTDVAKILGIAEWGDAIDVWKDKTSDELNRLEMNEKMEFGLRLEPVLAAAFMDRTNLKVLSVDETLQHPIHEIFQVNLDYVYERDGKLGPLEMKTTSKQYHSGWKYDLPLSYYAQVQWQLYITLALGYCQHYTAYVPLLVGGQEFLVVPVEYDQEFIEQSVPKLLDFWNDHVVKKIPPEPSTGDQVEKIYMAVQGKHVDANEDIFKTIQRLAFVKTKIKEYESEEAEIKDQLKVVMRDADHLDYDGQTLATWKTINKTRFSQKEFQADYPDLAEQYLKEGSYRSFLVKYKGEK